MGLKERTSTAIVLLLVILALVQWAPRLIFFLFLQIIILAAVVEFFGLARRRQAGPQTGLGLVLAIIISLSFLWPQQLPLALTLVISFVIFSLYFIIYTNSIEKVVIFPAAAALTFLAPLYISFPLNFFYWLRLENGPKVIYLLFVIIFLGDTGAYLIGQKFGRHRLVPLASPKKTVEGAIAGLIWATLGALLFCWLVWPSLSALAAVALGLITHTVAQIADPLESLFKRAAGVKDSSNLLPGHGGFLDRVDSLLLATPVYYFLLKLFLP